MKNKIFSVFKSYRDAVIGVVDNFGIYAQAFIAIIIAGLVVTALGVLVNWQFAKEFSAIQAAIKSCKDVVCEIEMVKPLLSLIGQVVLPLSLTILVFLLFLSWIDVGYTKFLLQMHDDKESHIKVIFSSNFWQALKFFVASFLYFVIVSIGLLLLVLPGIYFAIRFSFYKFYIVDKNAGILESLSDSWDATHHYGWDLLAFFLIYYAVGVFGIITFPIVGLAQTCAYRQISGSESKSEKFV